MSSTKKIGIARFLGTNCDRDIWQAVEMAGYSPEWLWYDDHFDVKGYSGFVIPGGFSYGDYLRSGALAAKSKVMTSLREAHVKGMPILGICNGFQILCEAQMLPGALLKNESLRFIDRWVGLKVENPISHFAGEAAECILPIAHGDGRYYADKETIQKMWDTEQVWLTYQDNPNGSIDSIAGVKVGKTAGLMPHPERAVFDWMGSSEGLEYFLNIG